MLQKCEYSINDENQIIKYLPLVESIVDRMAINPRNGMERDDYITLGIIGLMEALKKYDPSLNKSFEHYAKWRVKGAIYDELRKMGSISRSKMDKLNEMYRAKMKLQQDLMREPTDEEICLYMQISNKDLQGLYEAAYYLSYASLEDTLFVTEDEYTIMDMIEDKDAVNPHSALEEEELKGQLVQAINQLNEKEQIVLDLYYNKELPLKDIATVLDVSISRVSQIHGKILLKLRSLLSDK